MAAFSEMLYQKGAWMLRQGRCAAHSWCSAVSLFTVAAGALVAANTEEAFLQTSLLIAHTQQVCQHCTPSCVLHSFGHIGTNGCLQRAIDSCCAFAPCVSSPELSCSAATRGNRVPESCCPPGTWTSIVVIVEHPGGWAVPAAPTDKGSSLQLVCS